MTNKTKINSNAKALFSNWFSEETENNEDTEITTVLEKSQSTDSQKNIHTIEDNDMNENTKENARSHEGSDMSEKNSDTSIDIQLDSSTSEVLVESLHKEVKSMDIAISGSTYNVNCYTDEIDDLNKAVEYINTFLRGLRKDAPTLEHENLLVLCCLNMYEEMKQEEHHRIQLQEVNEQASKLIKKINEDVDSVLP